jgi:arylsulfatase A-like enzyme
LQQHREERFFLWLYYLDPHTTYAPSAPFPSLPAGVSEERGQSLRTLDFWMLVDSGPALLLPQDIPTLISLYDGEIHDVDTYIGAVFDELERLNLSDRTLVVLHSDHGEAFADHGSFAHGNTFYEELVHIPLIIAGPGVPPSGQGVDTPVALLNLLPTLLAAGGIAPPAESHGCSLWPLLRGETMDETPIYSEMLHSTIYDRKAIRYQGWKLIYGLVDKQVELYDLGNDPGEQHNLAKDEPLRAAEYLQMLEDWIAEARMEAKELPRSLPPVQNEEQTRALLRQSGY